MKQKHLWITCGVPGCGKSTWAKNFKLDNPNTVICSRDKIRFAILEDNEDYFSKEQDVYREFIRWIQDNLDAEGDFNIIADATHLSPKSRRLLLDNLNLSNVKEIHTVWFDVDFETCWERNSKREGRAFVPKSAVRRMFFSFNPPTKDETYSYTIHHIGKDGQEM